MADPATIERLAREAGAWKPEGLPSDWDAGDCVLSAAELARFAALIAAHERERCAKVAQETVCDTHLPTGIKIYGTRAAAAIRAL
jgi:hypothetical protein